MEKIRQDRCPFHYEPRPRGVRSARYTANIGFEAENEHSNLPIVSKLAAHGEATFIERLAPRGIDACDVCRRQM